ncbi:hypothetical protein EC973_002329 [Apophysomyces ossiformis]|uniref:Uncharacterized protein n=1 Tax=Apophysomyces ossiformis TaxID=679940 RepID=A0A8H7BNU3_9FUNG|nr:hypothetical protein EC973_002329 [Apophysomyces ossiformis]
MEETGFCVNKSDIVLATSPVSYEPGMTDSCCYVAQVIIDVDKCPQQEQQLQEDELGLITICLSLDNLQEELEAFVRSHDSPIVVDSRVHAYASGLAIQKLLKRTDV